MHIFEQMSIKKVSAKANISWGL